MIRLKTLAAAAPLLLATGLGSAAHAAVLEDFPFDDADGTLLADAANAANPGNQWSVDTTDQTETAVEAGALVVRKNNDGFATNFLQIDNITSGQAWLVAEFAGGTFAEAFDPSEREEIRFAFLDNDTGTGGSTLTAQMQIERNDDGTVQLVGNNAGAGTDIPGALPLPLSQDGLFTLVLALDKDANTYEVFTRDGNGPFSSLGTGDVDPTRNGNSLRFVTNNGFGAEGEFFALDRVYLTDTNPIPEPASAALLGAGAWALGRRRR